MNWNHIKLIFEREVRDQLRDRRTMFTIFFLPILLYPLMGIVMFEVAQIPKQNNVTIGVVGSEHIPTTIRLFEDEDPSIRWKKLPSDRALSHAFAESEKRHREPASTEPRLPATRNIEEVLREYEVDLLVAIPEDFAEHVWESSIHVVSNQRWERSLLASSLFQARVEGLHRTWVRETLDDKGVGAKLLEPPRVDVVDFAPPESKRALIWSKILPFVMLIWALTGAFYPAVDLCAGEKERGTLETLLCSPANRREIVWGKLLTILCFSLGTALLNLFSMYATATLVMSRFQTEAGEKMMAALGPLPITSLIWLILLVIPMSAMFSALALAVASLAKSTKEGQYYLMPLLLVGMPLVMLPMIPGIVLSPGTSIIPVTGAVLVSKTLMDGEFLHAMLHLPTVATVTVLCTLLATRWAVRQFESESVMFCDASRVTLRSWLRNAWRQRDITPTASESTLCGMLILVTLFFGRLSMSSNELNWSSMVQSTLVVQIGLMLAPALIMATLLTRSIRTALRIHQVSFKALLACVALAVALHPTYSILAVAISHEFKLGEETTAMLQQFDGLLASAPIASVLFVMALVPAICEELVFRGFIFSGLERNKGHVRAILISALLFGLSHGVLQQTLTATLMGLLLGWIAYRTGGVICAIAFHGAHNSLSMLIGTCSSRGDAIPSWLTWAVTMENDRWAYTDLWSTMSIGIAILLIAWIASLNSKNRRAIGFWRTKPYQTVST